MKWSGTLGIWLTISGECDRWSVWIENSKRKVMELGRCTHTKIQNLQMSSCREQEDIQAVWQQQGHSEHLPRREGRLGQESLQPPFATGWGSVLKKKVLIKSNLVAWKWQGKTGTEVTLAWFWFGFRMADLAFLYSRHAIEDYKTGIGIFHLEFFSISSPSTLITSCPEGCPFSQLVFFCCFDQEKLHELRLTCRLFHSCLFSQQRFFWHILKMARKTDSRLVMWAMSIITGERHQAQLGMQWRQEFAVNYRGSGRKVAK